MFERLKFWKRGESDAPVAGNAQKRLPAPSSETAVVVMDPHQRSRELLDGVHLNEATPVDEIRAVVSSLVQIDTLLKEKTAEMLRGLLPKIVKKLEEICTEVARIDAEIAALQALVNEAKTPDVARRSQLLIDAYSRDRISLKASAMTIMAKLLSIANVYEALKQVSAEKEKLVAQAQESLRQMDALNGHVRSYMESHARVQGITQFADSGIDTELQRAAPELVLLVQSILVVHEEQALKHADALFADVALGIEDIVRTQVAMQQAALPLTDGFKHAALMTEIQSGHVSDDKVAASIGESRQLALEILNEFGEVPEVHTEVIGDVPWDVVYQQEMKSFRLLMAELNNRLATEDMARNTLTALVPCMKKLMPMCKVQPHAFEFWVDDIYAICFRSCFLTGTDADDFYDALCYLVSECDIERGAVRRFVSSRKKTDRTSSREDAKALFVSCAKNGIPSKKFIEDIRKALMQEESRLDNYKSFLTNIVQARLECASTSRDEILAYIPYIILMPELQVLAVSHWKFDEACFSAMTANASNLKPEVVDELFEWRKKHIPGDPLRNESIDQGDDVFVEPVRE